MQLQLDNQPLTYGARYFDGMLDADVCEEIIAKLNQSRWVEPASTPWFNCDVLELSDDLVANDTRWRELDEIVQRAVGTTLQRYCEAIPGAPLSQCIDQGYFIHRIKEQGYLSPCTFNSVELANTILHVSFFLNEGYAGGYTRIEPKGDEIPAAVGRAIVVPATWLYAVAEDPVISGTKYKLSTSIQYAPRSTDPDSFDNN